MHAPQQVFGLERHLYSRTAVLVGVSRHPKVESRASGAASQLLAANKRETEYRF
jgi:hypothetical protein